MSKTLFKLSCYFMILALLKTAHAASSITLTISDNNEISAEIYGKGNALRVLWIAPSYGVKPRHAQVAQALAEKGFEVWQVDLTESLFLPRSTQTMRDLPGEIVADLISLLTRDGKRLLLISSSYGAIPTLNGIHSWQKRRPRQRDVIGAILFSPYFYTHVPPVGEAPQFVPVTQATSVPIYIFQAAKNGNRWHFPALLKQLQLHAPVYSEIMPGVTSMYYDEDMADETLTMLNTVADKIKRRLPLLAQQDYPLSAVPLTTSGNTPGNIGLDSTLRPYRGSTQAQAFSLQDVNGQTITRSSFAGQVTVINFWATWCPPCVEEIPSLNRLRDKMQGKAFDLISINYAESAESIKAFMQKVKVDFPVLLDPEGRLAGDWKVVAFPSTFVIGPDGKIHYGVNAAIHWDTAEVVQQLQSLLIQP